MDWVAIPAERVGQPLQLSQKPGARRNLALGHRVEGGHRLAKLSHKLIALFTAHSVHVSHHARTRSVCLKAMGEDCWMRWATVATLGAAFIAALVTGCSASMAPARATAGLVSAARPARTSPGPGGESCYAFAVSALRRRVVVRERPPACAGVPQLQVNQDVARAIRTVVGPHPKAVARRLSVALSRYLANLVRPVRPPPAESVATGAPASSGAFALRFTALAAWLAAALAGAYLLAGWPTRGRRRLAHRLRALPALPLGHAALATTGLVIWIAFTVTTAAALAWADVGLTWVITGLGMATLLTGPGQSSLGTDSATPRKPAARQAAPFPSQVPVIVIVLHGALATLTILVVLLAAVAAG